MTHQIDLDQLDAIDRRNAVQRAAELLGSGGLLRLQLAEGCWAATPATNAQSVTQFLSLDETAAAALMVLNGQMAADLVPQPSRLLSRLLRGHSGPLVVEVPESAVDAEILSILPEATVSLVLRQGYLRLAPPGGDVTRQMLMHTRGPLIVCHAAAENLPGEYDMLLAESVTSTGSPTVIRIDVAASAWKIASAGTLTHNDIERLMPQRIVFVCTGNTCRSPMAEAMFRKLLCERLNCASDELPARGYHVLSAGIAATDGAAASPESVEICNAQGVDLRSHASQPLTVELLEQSDRLYTMTAGHREAIVSRYPQLAERVELLARNGEDVSDPIGLGRPAYDKCYAEITENLRILVDQLTSSNSSPNAES